MRYIDSDVRLITLLRVLPRGKFAGSNLTTQIITSDLSLCYIKRLNCEKQARRNLNFKRR